MKQLTPRQAEVLALIRSAVQQTGMPPTRAEIASELGFKSANAAEEHLKALARKGVIHKNAAARKKSRLAKQLNKLAQ